MIYLRPDDSITLLPLSARALRCAFRNDVKTIERFIAESPEDWGRSWNLGVKTLEELQHVRTSILNGTGDYLLINNVTSKPSESDTNESQDIPVEIKTNTNIESFSQYNIST